MEDLLPKRASRLRKTFFAFESSVKGLERKERDAAVPFWWQVKTEECGY